MEIIPVLAVLVLALTACGGSADPVAQPASCELPQQLPSCASSCTLTRSWALTCDAGTGGIRILPLTGGTANVQWSAQEAGAVTCNYSVALTPIPGDGSAGTGTSSVQSSQSVAGCPTLPEHFNYFFDQCNCVLGISAGTFHVLYY